MLPPLASNERGEFRQISFSPSIALLVGDTVEQVGNQLVVTRGGTVIATRTLSGMGSVVDGPVQEGRTVSSFLYFRSFPVVGQNVSCIGVTENPTTGVTTFRWSDGTADEIGVWDADVKAVADSFDATADVAKKALVCKAYRQSPDGANKTTQVGAAVSVNGLADNPFVYTPAE